MDKKITVEVAGLTQEGLSVSVKEQLDNYEGIQAAIAKLQDGLKSKGIQGITNNASFAPKQMIQSITPRPTVADGIPEAAGLANAPYSYKAPAAAYETLDPKTSKWAQKSHTRKEIQDVLLGLGVQGINDAANFDAVLRDLVGQGKLRRQKNGHDTWEYYRVE